MLMSAGDGDKARMDAGPRTAEAVVHAAGGLLLRLMPPIAVLVCVLHRADSILHSFENNTLMGAYPMFQDFWRHGEQSTASMSGALPFPACGADAQITSAQRSNIISLVRSIDAAALRAAAAGEDLSTAFSLRFIIKTPQRREVEGQWYPQTVMRCGCALSTPGAYATAGHTES